MTPKHLQVYYSGLIYTKPNQIAYIYLQPCSYLGVEDYTTLDIYSLLSSAVNTLKLEYLPFTSPILANTHFSTLSDFSIHDRISYTSFTCATALDIVSLEDREYIYDLSVDNPVEVPSYSGTVDGMQEFLYPSSYNSIKELIVTGLPNSIATLSTLEGISTKSKWLVPSSTSGWLSNLTLADNMEYRWLEGICFGLLASCAFNDLNFIVIQLKEFVNQCVQLEYIVKTNTGAWQLNTAKSYGFYPSQSILSYTSTYELKEIPYNSLLLFALCSALQVITDNPLTLEYNLDGQWGDFKEQLLLCLRSQALFVANSVSPVSNLCAYKLENGYYTYNILSYSASCYAALGLSLYLSYSYDSYIHTQAAKLQSTLIELSLDVTSPVYSNFTERDLSVVANPLELSLTDQVTYNKILSLGAQALWLSYFNPTAINDCADQYELYRNGYSITDNLFVAAFTKLELTIPSFISTTGLAASIEEQPVFTALSNAFTFDVNTDLDIAQVFSAACIKNNYKSASNHFDLVALKASAYVTATLLELRRMMPYGLKWFDESKVNDVSSVIGSMLYAEADLYWSWALQLDTYIKSASAFTAVSDDAINWFNNKYNSNVLATDGFLKQLQVTDSSKTITDLTSLCSFLSEFLGVTVSYTRPTVPAFCIYKSNSVNDLLDNYTTNNQVIDLDTGYMNKAQYLSIVYKKQAGKNVLRAVPGFPIKPEYKPVDVQVMTIEDYLANPVSGVVVSDGPVYIYPLTDYVMQATLNISEMTKQLVDTLNDVPVLGLDLNFVSTLEFVGEE